MSYTLAKIAEHIGATVKGDESCVVEGLATLSNASKGQIAFLANAKYNGQLKDTNASAVIVSPESVEHCPCNALVMENPYLGYAKAAQLLDTTPPPASSIHDSAVISEGVSIGGNVKIGANSIIESGVKLADGVVIGAGCFIGKNAEIGVGTALWANVSVYHNVVIGSNCLVQSNTVIGSDGFGYANDKGSWIKIPQLGTVIIGDNVEIGASTTIDRGALEDTVINDGVILDNQIQIAHNVVIGQNTAIAACSVVAGSTTIGKNCVIAGLCGINGHIEIADGSVFTGMSMVTKATKAPGVYSSGIPSLPNKDWRKMNVRMRKLDEMSSQLSNLQKEIEQLTQNKLLNKEE